MAVAGELIQRRARADANNYLGKGEARRAEAGDRALRRERGRLRRRLRAAPGEKPRGGDGPAGGRPQRDHPRHLRRPRGLGRGQAPGRARPAAVQPRAHARSLEVGEEKTIEADYVLVTVGRRPNTDEMGLESTGINIGERGLIEVDKQCRTNVPSYLCNW